MATPVAAKEAPQGEKEVRNMSMFRKKDEGFTLVELMVVVLIIGILVAIAIPVFNAARANAQERACFANQRTVEGAVQQYRAGELGDDAVPADLTALWAALVPEFVQAQPVCNAGGAYAWTAADLELNCTAAGTFAGHGHYTD